MLERLRSMLRTFLIPFYCAILVGCGGIHKNRIVVGSKNFTEQAILGELLAQHLEAHTGLSVDRRFYLAGTYICHQAILAGRVDLYVEYTGTALGAILKQSPSNDSAQVYERVKNEYAQRFQLAVEAPLGFNNTFALVTRGPDARRLHLRTISQAARFAPQWRAGFGYEFMERLDGYQGLVRTYGLRFAAQPRIMDLGLLYRSLVEKQVDLVAGNSTDGLIAARDLAVLEDDRRYFPPYQAVPIVRMATLTRHPEVGRALQQLAGMISDQDMRQMNYLVDGGHKDIQEVVREFLRSKHLD
jgi:glycine betaine/choline ABC-type transport system substrate-binding protein